MNENPRMLVAFCLEIHSIANRATMLANMLVQMLANMLALFAGASTPLSFLSPLNVLISASEEYQKIHHFRLLMILLNCVLHVLVNLDLQSCS